MSSGEKQNPSCLHHPRMRCTGWDHNVQQIESSSLGRSGWSLFLYLGFGKRAKTDMGTTVLAYGILCSMLLFVNHPKITSQQHSLDQSAVSDCWRVCVSKDLAPLVQWVQKSAPGSARSLWKKSEKETATLTFLILQMFYLALQFWGKMFKSEEKQKQTVRLHEWTNRLTLRDDTISYCFTWLFGYGKKKK